MKTVPYRSESEVYLGPKTLELILGHQVWYKKMEQSIQEWTK